MKHIKQFEARQKSKKTDYSNYLTKLFSTNVKVEIFGDVLDIKIEQNNIDELFIKNLFHYFGSDIKFLIKQRPYTSSVTITVYSISTSILDMMLNTNKYNL